MCLLQNQERFVSAFLRKISINNFVGPPCITFVPFLKMFLFTERIYWSCGKNVSSRFTFAFPSRNTSQKPQYADKHGRYVSRRQIQTGIRKVCGCRNRRRKLMAGRTGPRTMPGDSRWAPTNPELSCRGPSTINTHQTLDRSESGAQ